MTLKQRIDNDIKAALLGGNRFGADILRNLKAAILNEEVAQQKRDEGLSDGDVEQVIAREVKKRNESIKLYVQGGRQELADAEQAEIDVLAPYLPVQLSEAEIQALIDEAIATTGAASPADMGKVIGAVKAKAGTSADGALVARLVKTTLTK